MKRRVVLTILIAFWMMTMPACTREGAEKPPDKVSVRLKWRHQPQFAGFYTAIENGFYQDENLTVTLEPGGPDEDEIGHVAAGTNDFGVVAAPGLIVRQSQGIKTKALAVVFRKSPLVYFSMKGSGIKKPVDFIGKKAMVFPNDFVFQALMNKMGVDMERILKIAPSFDMERFFNRQIDVWSGYLTNQIVTARARGFKLNLIFPGDYGIHTYGDTIITTAKLIEERPELVERFLRATLRGWRWAIENPDAAARLVLKYDPQKEEPRQIAEMVASVPLVHTGEDQIGWMKKIIWQGMHDMLLEQGIITNPVPIDDIFTLRFLQKMDLE